MCCLNLFKQNSKFKNWGRRRKWGHRAKRTPGSATLGLQTPDIALASFRMNFYKIQSSYNTPFEALIVLFVFLFTLKLHAFRSFFICKKILESESTNHLSKAYTSRCEYQDPQSSEMSSQTSSFEKLICFLKFVQLFLSTIRSSWWILRQSPFWIGNYELRQMNSRPSVNFFHPCFQNKSYLCLWFEFFQSFLFDHRQKHLGIKLLIFWCFDCMVFCESLQS